LLVLLAKWNQNLQEKNSYDLQIIEAKSCWELWEKHDREKTPSGTVFTIASTHAALDDFDSPDFAFEATLSKVVPAL